MRVLIVPSEHFVPAESPLAGIFQYDQARALQAAGIHVAVVAPELRSLRGVRRLRSWRRRGFDATPLNGMQVFRWHGWHWGLPGIAAGRAAVWLRAGRELVRRYVAVEGKPDVVHAHNARYAGMLATWIKATYGVPYVLTEHSSVYPLGRVPTRELPAIRSAYAEAAIRFFVSGALAESVEQVVGTPARPYEVLPNLLDAQFEKLDLSDRDAMRPFRFLNVAELNPNKRHVDLLHAFSRVASARECELRIVGDGPLAQRLSSLSKKLGVHERVRFMGRLDRSGVRREMLACDAFVLASRRETFGVVLAEALACGKPVVATASGGPDSIVTPSNGFLVQAEAIDALTDALTRMIDEHERFEPAVIRRQCLDRFGSERIVRRLLDAYERIATNSLLNN